MAKSRPRKNQSERSDLPCHIINHHKFIKVLQFEQMFVTAVYVLFLLKLKWPNPKNFYGAPYSYRKEKETHELIFSWLAWLVVLLVGAYARRRRRERRSYPTWRPYSKKYVTYSLGLPLTNCWFSDWIAHVGLTCCNQGRVVLKPDSRLNILTKVLFCLFVCFFY